MSEERSPTPDNLYGTFGDRPPSATPPLLPTNGVASLLLPTNGVASLLLPTNGVTSLLLPTNGVASLLLPTNGIASLPVHDGTFSSDDVETSDYSDDTLLSDGIPDESESKREEMGRKREETLKKRDPKEYDDEKTGYDPGETVKKREEAGFDPEETGIKQEETGYDGVEFVGKDEFDLSHSVNSTRCFPHDDTSMSNLLNLSVQSSRRSWSDLVTVEPVIFLFTLAMMLTSPVQTALYLVHTCRGELGYNATTCSTLEGTSSPALEALVQPSANVYVMWATIVETCVPAVLTLFVGPWSDKHGRKTFLVLPIVGYMLKYVLCLVFSLYPALPPAYLLLASIPVSLGGGLVSVISLCYCYITDITTEQRRGFRMGMVEACFYTGLLLGTAASTYLFSAGGYVAVYGTSVALCCLAFLHGVFFLAESVPDADDCSGACVLGLFNCGLVKEMLTTCCKKRGYGRRSIIFLIIVIMAMGVLSMEGDSAVVFMFTRHKFSWDIQHFTTYASVAILMQILGTVIGVSVLSAWLGIADTPLAIFSFALKIVATLLTAFSPAWWYMYLAAAVGMFGAVAGPLCRAILSKTVDHQDVGKVFSLLSVAEAVTPLAAAPLYTYVYNATLLGFPGAFFLLTVAVFMLDLVLLVIVATIQRLHPVPQYDRLATE